MTQRAFKYRFYPTPEQETLLRRTMGCTRLVYNRALAVRTQAWYDEKKRVGYSDTSALLTEWKKQDDLQLVRENQTIAVEDLASKNMVKNRKLALSISDASWGELVRQLEYKCDWYGRTLVKIDRWFPSSKRCGKCGHIVEKLPLNIREWDCPNCGAHHDRDINAAQNILAAGLAVKVCGANVRPDRHKSDGSCDEAERSKK
jgi:putative transposase